MNTKKPKDNNMADVVLKRLASKPKKIAKTFSVSEDNYMLLEKWCDTQNKRKKGKERVVPSNVVDELIKTFLEQIKLTEE